MVIAQSADAMTCLQAIYTNPSIKPEVRAAAAKAVLPHQHPKLSIQGYANVTTLAQRLDGVPAKVIELPKPDRRGLMGFRRFLRRLDPLLYQLIV